MQVKINFNFCNYLAKDFLKISEKKFESMFNLIVSKHKKEEDLKYELSLYLETKEKMKELNNEYRKNNVATDVLTFPFNDKIKDDTFFMGDIFINWDLLAKERNIDIFIKLFIHSILHLLGFTHEKIIDWKIMSFKEKRYFIKFKKLSNEKG